MLKDQTQANKITKNIYNHVDKFYLNPKIDLDIEGALISQVVVDFVSQVNILPRSTWIKLGWPELVKSYFYLKLVDQGLVEPLGIWKYVEMTIRVISTRVKFEVIEPKLGSSCPSLFSGPWGRNTKSNISLDKDKIKLEGKGKKVIIPLDPR